MNWLTWQLWTALHAPRVEHPLFQRLAGNDRLSGRVLWIVERIGPTAVFSGVALCTGMWFLPHLVLLPQLFLAWGSTPLAFITLNGTLFGAVWAASIARTLATEYTKKRYDVLAIASGGKLPAAWTIATACLHRRQLFQLIYLQRNAILFQIILPAAVLLVIGLALSTPISVREQAFVVLAVSYGCVMVAYYFDYVHSMVLCALAGMLAPALARNTLNAPLWGPSVFLLCQSMVYLSAVLVDFVALPLLFGALGWRGVGADIAIAVLRLLAFIAAREGMLWAVWTLLVRVLNTNHDELERVFGRA